METTINSKTQRTRSNPILKNLFYVLNLFLLFHLHYSTIKIWYPESLRQIYKTKDLKYSLANFGDVPYGHTIFGMLDNPSPSDGCSELIRKPKENAKILVFDRGGCHFGEKVLNGQNAGAKLVMIIDNVEEDVKSIFPVELGIKLLRKVCLYLDSSNFNI